MEITSILLARATAWVEAAELNPKGQTFYPDLTKALVTRYNFQIFPQKAEDYDQVKGIVFGAGKLGKSTIEQIVIYTYGLILDTRESTQESRHLLEEALQWASKELGLHYKSSMIKRWQYWSQISFSSKQQLLDVSPALRKLAEGIERSVNETIGEQLHYDLVSTSIDYDQLTRKHPLGRFSIQRRENTPFFENKYFSEAPLPTDVHIRLLEEFEAAILKK